MKVKAFIESESLKTESAVINAVSESAVKAAKTCLKTAAERETAAAVRDAAAYSTASRSVLSAFTPRGRGKTPLIVSGVEYTPADISAMLKQTGKKLPRRAVRETGTGTPNGVKFTFDVRYTSAECRKIRTVTAAIAAHVERTKVEQADRKECLGW